MAEAVLVSLLENLPRLLMKEVKLPSEVAGQIKLLHDRLGIQKAFLEVSDQGKRNEHAVIKVIVNQIRDAVHEAEDIIDTYIYHLNRQKIKNWWDLATHLNYSKMLHNVASKIEEIKVRIDEIMENEEKYGMKFGEVNHEEAEAVLADLNKRRRLVEEDDVVGFDYHSLVVVNKLTKGNKQREIVSIIGMGGLGKTTLARKIYKHNHVRSYFKCSAWADVSNDYEPKQLLLNILKQLIPKFHKISQEMSTEDLRMELCKSLETKRYLIILDDMWECKAWDGIKDAFPDNQNGSRILITSRLKKVANQLSASPLHYDLPFLSKEESWELFSKRVFRGEQCPADLEVLARKMAERCDRLPLSIVVLAGLMSTLERSKAQWSLVAGNENWLLSQQRSSCSQILALSYFHLPWHLKPCFLYIGLFPEDHEISVRHLTRLWIAEGLIPKDTGNKQPEDVAEFYLQELIDRSLIQIVKKRTDGGVKTCRIHDLLRVLCIEEAKKDKFYEVYAGNNNSTFSNARRLSLYCKTSSYLSSNLSTHNSSVRSLICFAQDPRPRIGTWDNNLSSHSAKYWKFLVKGFKLVRVIDVSRASIIHSIPDHVRKLIHLRYLRIDIDKAVSYYLAISNYTCDLRNLETLDVKGSRLSTLPPGLWKLKWLRHLLMSGIVKIPSLSEPLDNLQSLSTVALEDHTGFLFSEAMFPNLRKLGLHCRPDLKWTPNEFWPTLLCLSELQTLKIIGTNKLPQKAELFPLKLTKLTLVNVVGIDSHAMATLGAIPNLEVLKISGSLHLYPTFNIDCKTGEFENLKVFQMKGLHCKNWTLATGAMPRLQSAIISNCRALEMLPDELWSLTNLRHVQVSWPSKPLADTLRKLKLQDQDGRRLTILNDDGDK